MRKILCAAPAASVAATPLVTRIILALPPVKKALLAEQVQSRFLKALAG